LFKINEKSSQFSCFYAELNSQITFVERNNNNENEFHKIKLRNKVKQAAQIEKS